MQNENASCEVMNADNWKDRSLNMKCGKCMWFLEKRTSCFTDHPCAGTLGRCRKHAPTLGGWPAIYSSDWCGDHKIDETK